jgi:hypothetical protein
MWSASLGCSVPRPGSLRGRHESGLVPAPAGTGAAGSPRPAGSRGRCPRPPPRTGPGRRTADVLHPRPAGAGLDPAGRAAPLAHERDRSPYHAPRSLHSADLVNRMKTDMTDSEFPCDGDSACPPLRRSDIRRFRVSCRPFIVVPAKSLDWHRTGIRSCGNVRALSLQLMGERRSAQSPRLRSFHRERAGGIDAALTGSADERVLSRSPHHTLIGYRRSDPGTGVCPEARDASLTAAGQAETGARIR